MLGLLERLSPFGTERSHGVVTVVTSRSKNVKDFTADQCMAEELAYRNLPHPSSPLLA